MKRRNLRRVGTWITRDRRVLRIADMDTDHIRNTINMLRRRGLVPKGTRGPMPDFPVGLQGEFAQDAADQEFNAAFDQWLSAPPESAALLELETELARRAHQ